MKTRRLIELLRAADPSGELECCVANADVLDVATRPAYWDGTLEVLARDEARPRHNVVGARYQGAGHKVVIKPLPIVDALAIDPDLPVDYAGCGSPARAARYKAEDDAARAEIRAIRRDPDGTRA